MVRRQIPQLMLSSRCFQVNNILICLFKETLLGYHIGVLLLSNLIESHAFQFIISAKKLSSKGYEY